MSTKILFAPSDNSLKGAFQSMVRLCVLLRDKWGCEVLVLVRKGGEGEILLTENNIPFVKIPTFNWILPDRPKTDNKRMEWLIKTATKPAAQLVNQLAIVRIKRLIKRENVDIVHLNTTYTYAPAKAAYSCGVPVVWHLREFLEEDQHKRIWNRRYGYKLISRAAAVIAISESVYNKYRPILKGTNLLKIYNGLDENYYSCPPRDLFQSETIHILMVGTIIETKGQMYAIQALKKLIDDGRKNVELTIVGQLSQYAQQLKKYVEGIGLSDHIHFPGLQKDTASFYHRSDIVLVCSYFEAFGRVTVEAMMGGCVVIGANTGGTVELIRDKDTGYLYEGGNVDDLKRAIEYVMDHRDEANAVARRGQQYMLSNMTAEKNADAVYSVYADILKSKQHKAHDRA